MIVMRSKRLWIHDHPSVSPWSVQILEGRGQEASGQSESCDDQQSDTEVRPVTKRPLFFFSAIAF